MSETQSMYDRVGGAPAVGAVVDDFYRRVLADDKLAGYFDGVDMPGQRRHLAALISQVMGGPRQYTGRELAEAHAPLGVTDEAFDRVAGHLGGALSDNQVPPDISAALGSTVESLRDQVVTRA